MGLAFNQTPKRTFVADTGDFDTSNTSAVRKYVKTYGLTPPGVDTYEIQAKRCLKQLESKTQPIDKYLYLSGLRNTNVHLFYRLAVDHMKTMTPLIYTPVVGEACQKWSEIYQQPEGLYISYSDKGQIASVLQNWPHEKVEISVVTDGSRILGLGDLGINGMGIPVGKLALYSACGGIRPSATLPITLDLGTSNKALREDPLYLGSRRDKVTPEEEMEFLDEMMEAMTERWPGYVSRLIEQLNTKLINLESSFNSKTSRTHSLLSNAMPPSTPCSTTTSKAPAPSSLPA